MKIDSVFLIPAILLLLVFLGVNLYRFLRKRKSASLLFSDIRSFPSQNFSKNLFLFYTGYAFRTIALILLLVALIRPQWGETRKQISKEGIGIHMLIDRSSSMNQKMEHKGQIMTRLDAVKRVFKSFVLGDKGTLKGRTNDLISVSGFAFFSDEYAPFTQDHKTLAGFVDQIQPAEKYEDGTMIGDAIYQTVLRLVASEKELQEKSNGYRLKSKIMILLTDGEQTQGGMSPTEAAKFAKENNIKIYAIVIVKANNSFFQDSFTNFFSFPSLEIDTSLMQKVAEITGGKFAKVESGESLESFYETIDRLEKTKISQIVMDWRDYFPNLVALAIALLILEQIIFRLFLRKI